MKKMTWGKVSVFVLAVSLVAISCSKAKDGTNGTNGTNGAPGAPGTANVIYSAWLDVNYTTTDSIEFDATIAAPKLVDSILQKGTILVYLNIGSTAAPQIVPIPFATSILDFFSVGSIALSADGPYSTYVQSGVKFQQCRYILIPGGVAGRSAINWKDYQQVKQYLGLKD